MGTGYSVAKFQRCTGEEAGVATADAQGEATQLQEVNNYIIVSSSKWDASIGSAVQRARRLPHVLPWGTPEPELEESSDSQEEKRDRDDQEDSDFVIIPCENSGQESPVSVKSIKSPPNLQGTGLRGSGTDSLIPGTSMASQDPVDEAEDVESRDESPQPEVTPADHEGLVWEISFSSSPDEQKPRRSIPKFLRQRERAKTQTPRTDQAKKDVAPVKPLATKLPFKSPPFRPKVTPEKKGPKGKSSAALSPSPQSAKSPEARSSTSQKPKKSPLFRRISPQKSPKAEKKGTSPQGQGTGSEKDKSPKVRLSSAGKPSPAAKSPGGSPRASLSSLRSSSSLLPNQPTFSNFLKKKRERKGAKEWISEARARTERSTSSEKMEEDGSEGRGDKTESDTSEASQSGSSSAVWEINLSDIKTKKKPAGQSSRCTETQMSCVFFYWQANDSRPVDTFAKSWRNMPATIVTAYRSFGITAVVSICQSPVARSEFLQ